MMHNDQFCLPNILRNHFFSTLTIIIITTTTTTSPKLRILWRLLFNVFVCGTKR